MTLLENNTIKIASLVAILPTFFISVWFVASLSFTQNIHAKTIEKQEQRMDAQTALLLDIRDRLIRLESNNAKKGRGD